MIPPSLRATEGSWAVRKAAAIRAYHEWMPTRVPDPKNPISFYRSFQFGGLPCVLTRPLLAALG